MMTPAYPHHIVLGYANGGSESCIVGIPPEKAAIGSAGLSGGSDRVDTRICFAY